MPGRAENKCKIPREGTCLVFSRNSEMTMVAGLRKGDEIRRQTGPWESLDGILRVMGNYWWREGKAVTSSVTMCIEEAESNSEV